MSVVIGILITMIVAWADFCAWQLITNLEEK
jgi:hypothetical protein